MVPLKVFLTLVFFITNNCVNAQTEFKSPCPRLFVYEDKRNEPDRWYGLVTLLSETTLSGVWLRLIFDRPSLQLGNWFGEVVTTDNKDYLVKNRNVQLMAHAPQIVQFYLKYNPNEPIPRLIMIRLNGRTICPEGISTESPQQDMMILHTSKPLEADAVTTPLGIINGVYDRGTITEEGRRKPPKPVGSYPWNQESSSPGEDLYPETIDVRNFDSSDVCGTVTVQQQLLVNYGQGTQEGQFPWHAALYHVRGVDLVYVCGSSLISKHYILTAAHCVTITKSQRPLIPENLVVYLGKYHLRRFSSPGIQYSAVSEIKLHPQYNSQNYKNDIAVVKLRSPANVTDYVRPVCLWQESVDLDAVVNKQGSVVGWGFDKNGKVSEQLVQANMPVVSQETCLLSFPEFYSRFASSNTYCAGFINETSICSGDSGSGMVFPLPHTNKSKTRWQLRGLVSLTVQNQLKCDSSNYVVFVDSAKYLDWIKKVMTTAE